MGSPAAPTPEQVLQLKRTAQLQTRNPPEWRQPAAGAVDLAFSLPRQAVSLLVLHLEADR
jgi:hypothetical protein